MNYEHIFTIVVHLVSASLAGAVSEAATLPLDTVKVRLQIDRQSGKSDSTQRGTIAIIRDIIKHEGIGTLYSSLSVSLHRQVIFSVVALGLYDPLFLCGNDCTNPGLATKILSGFITGVLGVLIASPMVRMQAQKRDQKTKETDEGWLGMLLNIIDEEGVLALWRGSTPNMIRNVILNIMEVVTFDEVYTRLSASKTFGPGLLSLIIASGTAGYLGVTTVYPIDVIKTRIMNSKGGTQVGLVKLIMNMLSNEGIFVFYKGLLVGSTRTVIWDVIYFVIKPYLIEIVGGPTHRIWILPMLAMISLIDTMWMLIFFLTRNKKSKKHGD